jgi:hypothetical protein
MNDFQWTLMIGQLKGARFDDFESNKVAQMSCGVVKESRQYLKLSERLYTPTVMEKFAFQTIGPKAFV